MYYFYYLFISNLYITSVLVITRYQQLGSFNDKNFFLGILEAEKSNIKVETK